MSTHVFVPVGELYSPGDGTPLYKPYGYVPPQRVCFLRCFGLKTCIDQALVTRVVQTLDCPVHWLNHYPPEYPLNSAIGFSNIYPLDSDLSGGQRYPTFEQPGPGAIIGVGDRQCMPFSNKRVDSIEIAICATFSTNSAISCDTRALFLRGRRARGSQWG